MNWNQAESELKKLAAGDACFLKHEKMFYSSSGSVHEYQVYINRMGIHTGKTWEEAISKLKEAIDETD